MNLISHLAPGMVLAVDLIGRDGILQLGVGQKLNVVIIERLKILMARQLIDDTIWIRHAALD